MNLKFLKWHFDHLLQQLLKIQMNLTNLMSQTNRMNRMYPNFH
jgi:hypothetical protein